MYELYIANKNYSSWSLRPWLLLRERGIAFDEKLVPFLGGVGANWDEFRAFSPSGKVPCLRDGDTVVWDSLAITEYVAEPIPACGRPMCGRARGRAAPPPRCTPVFPSCAAYAR